MAFSYVARALSNKRRRAAANAMDGHVHDAQPEAEGAKQKIGGTVEIGEQIWNQAGQRPQIDAKPQWRDAQRQSARRADSGEDGAGGTASRFMDGTVIDICLGEIQILGGPGGQ